ncbi:hypothetical protein CRX72_15620 [Pantoea sp. BRM17]|nr:hypothetical protein CRX72_15620 [Pantoea sp. BRM17]
MLKRINVVTSLIAVLLIFGALQLLSGGLFWSALNKDKEPQVTGVRHPQIAPPAVAVAAAPRRAATTTGAESHWETF